MHLTFYHTEHIDQQSKWTSMHFRCVNATIMRISSMKAVGHLGMMFICMLNIRKSCGHSALTCLLSSWSSRLASSLAFSTSLRVLLSSLASFWIAAFCSSKTASQLKFSSQTKLQLLHVWISIVKLATTYLQLVRPGVKAQLKFWIEFLYMLTDQGYCWISSPLQTT